METRAFIKDAAKLIEKIELGANTLGTQDEMNSQRDRNQKDLNQLFQGLQNPTVPTAYRLRDVALRAGYAIAPQTLNSLARFESTQG